MLKSFSPEDTRFMRPSTNPNRGEGGESNAKDKHRRSKGFLTKEAEGKLGETPLKK